MATLCIGAACLPICRCPLVKACCTHCLQVRVVASTPASSSGSSVSVVVSEGFEALLPMAGLFDMAKELARLSKQKAKVGGNR